MPYQLDVSELPATYKLLKIHVPDSFTSERIETDPLPDDWFHAMELTREMGDAWLESKVTPLLWVPSVVAPETSNLLVNSLHRQSSRIQIVDVQEHAFDERLR